MVFKVWFRDYDSGSMIQSMISGSLKDQNYFHNNVKRYLPFSLFSFTSLQWSFPEASWHMISPQMNVEADMRSQMFSIKPDMKEFCENTKQCYSSR